MDLFDLMVLLYVAVYIGPLLVPTDSPTLQLTFVYASFAVTLIMRPLGSAVFGPFADKNGRKRAMLIAVVGVALVTAAMGAVPTYAVAGIFAPITFVVLRLVQGLFVGGVVASTHTLGTETVPAKHRGLMSGIVSGGGAGLGALAASLLYLLLSSVLDQQQFSAFGWRIMFFSALVTGAVSFWVYSKTAESPLFKGKDEGSANKRKSPLKTLFSKQYLPIFLLNVLLVAGGASSYYLSVGFYPTFLETSVGLDGATAAKVMIVVNIVVVIGALLGGHLSDRIGRRSVFLYVGIPLLVIAPTLYLWMGNLGSNNVVLLGFLVAVVAFVALAWQAPILTFLNERFPTRIRATGTSLSWNIGFAVGGMMPTLVTSISPTPDAFASRLAIVMAVLIVVGIIAAATVGETRETDLNGTAELDDDASASATARVNQNS